MTDRELMQEALYALTYVGNKDIYSDTIDALRARLAQPEEPDWSAAGFSKPPKQWDRQCPSCGGFCKKSGCERENVQPEQEPVWVEVTTNTGDKFILDSAVEADKIRAARDAGLSVVPLYTTPPQREWQGLTEMEIMDICNFAKGQNGFFLVREVEAKLKEKNT